MPIRWRVSQRLSAKRSGHKLGSNPRRAIAGALRCRCRHRGGDSGSGGRLGKHRLSAGGVVDQALKGGHRKDHVRTAAVAGVDRHQDFDRRIEDHRQAVGLIPETHARQ